MKRSLQEIAEAVGAHLQGDGSVAVEGVASIGSASRYDLVFVEEEKYLARALQSGAGAVIAGEFAATASGKSLLICRNPKLTFARAARLLRDGDRDGDNAGVHPTAVVHSSVHLAPGAMVGEYCVIGADAEIGEGTRIGSGCSIARGVKIGRDCEIYSR
ncbi:MAG: LpxD N-terminal domain-containing protein, partial [Candidatus Sulfotelmatobacter sp.]